MLKTTVILISVGAVGASLLGSSFQSRRGADADRKSSDLKVSAGNARSLEVRIPLGRVTLTADGSHDLTVHIVRSTKGPQDAETRRWMNDSYITATNRDGVLVVRDHPFGSDTLKNIHSDDSGKTFRSGRSLDLDVQIHVPAELAAKLDVTAGEANVKGRFRSFNAEVMAGTLTTSGLRTSGNSELKVGAGTLNASLGGGSRGSSTLRVDAGEVKLEIPAGTSADVSADVAMGEIIGLPGKARKEEGIHFGDRRHGRTGNGESKVSIHVGTGSIKVDSHDQLEASMILDEKQAKSEEASDDDDAADIKDVDASVGQAVREAMEEVKRSMASLRMDMRMDSGDMKMDLGDMKVDMRDMKMDDLHELDHLDQDLSKSLRDLGPTIERAMKAARPDIERAMKSVRPEVEKAMKQARAEIDRAMKEVHPEVDRAIRRAMEGLNRALKEIEKDEKTNGK